MLFLGLIWRKMARNVYLIRHGQVESRFEGKLVGSTDADLSPKGVEQAARLSPFLAQRSPDICFSSPLRRCLQTATGAVSALNIEIVQQEKLREVDFGKWEGLGFDDIVAMDPDGVDMWIRCNPDFCFPQGEAIAQFITRIETMADFLLSVPEDNIAVVTHGGVIRFMLCHLLELDFQKHSIFEVNYAGVFTLKIFDRTAVLAEIINAGDM